MTRFIDYFFICGLPNNETTRFYHPFDDGSAVLTESHGKLVPSILCHYPKNNPDNPWKSAELWKFCTPEGVSTSPTKPTIEPRFHSFLITREDASRSYGHVLTFYEPCVDGKLVTGLKSLLPTTGDDIFVEKCICLITQHAYINTCEQVLRKLHKMFVEGGKTELPIESFLYNLLFEVPLIRFGSSVKLSCLGHNDPVIVHQPSPTELPLLDVHLSYVIRALGGAQNLVNLITSLLLEHQILLVSEDPYKLGVVAEGITALLFPFQWQHALISVLPHEVATHFFDAPVPYIIGVLAGGGRKEMIRQALEVNQCYVDLDHAIVEWPEEQPNFPNGTDLVEKLSAILDAYDKEVALGGKAGLDSGKHIKDIADNETVQRVAMIAHKAGALQSLDDINSLHANTKFSNSQMSERILREQKLNVAIRETMAAIFIMVFAQYDKFVIHSNFDDEDFDSHTNFDKTSFLSDQPTSRLRFLISFLDSQMFTSLIDNFISSQQNNEVKDPLLKLFDERIDQSKLPLDIKTPSSANSPKAVLRSISVSSSQNITSAYLDPWIKDAESAVTRRLTHIDVVTCPPHPLNPDQPDVINPKISGAFPNIQGSLLESEGLMGKPRHLQRMDNSRRTFKRLPSSRESKWRKVQEARSKLLRQPSMSEYSPELIAQTNWMFVDKLLKDTKHKTKKLLVCKMGREAFELGHGDLALSDLEESTWIASLCDLLERVWGHGLLTNYKKGKSALWSHLVQFQRNEQIRQMKHLGGSSPSLIDQPPPHPTSFHSLPRSFPRKKRVEITVHPNNSKRSENVSNPATVPPPEPSIVAAMRNVQDMREVHTEVGKSRAWIRLALEQKQLHSYLTQLISNRALLDRMYKRYSMLQCEDEREQFLFHLLSLNAVDFQCFTNAFTKTVTEYRVWVFPGRQFSGTSQTTANIHVTIYGDRASTHPINIPRGCLEFTFQHPNLGMMNTLTIGHDNAGILPKWLLECIVIRNEITHQTFYFPCNRWIGKGVDDNSLERLIVANLVPRNQTFQEFKSNFDAESKKNSRSIAGLQETVGRCVNSIVKYCHRPSDAHLTSPPTHITRLLLDGLVSAIMRIFTHGLKTGGFFQRKPFAWDVLTTACQTHQSNPTLQTKPQPPNNMAAGGDWFLGGRNNQSYQHNRNDESAIIRSPENIEKEMVAMEIICGLRAKIIGSQNRLGKDEMFKLLVCVCLRLHILPICLPRISGLMQTSHYFDESAFLIDQSAVSFLSQVIMMLNDYPIPIDQSLYRGLKPVLTT